MNNLFSQCASQDVRPSGPDTWKVVVHVVYNWECSIGLPIKQKVPGPTNPWNKSCAVNSRDPNWVSGRWMHKPQY